MSTELRLLLNRTRKWGEPTSEQVKPSSQLVVLLTRMSNRKWKTETINSIRHTLQELTNDLWTIDHFKTCSRCQAELTISIERYYGRNNPWYLNIQTEIGFPEIYEDEFYRGCPRLRDYEIGSYWTGTSEDTLRFIMDRCSWAKKKIKEIAVSATVFLEQVIPWNLEGARPIPDSILDMYYLH